MNPVNLLVIWYFGFVVTSPDQNVTVAGEKINLNIERLSVRITVTGKKKNENKNLDYIHKNLDYIQTCSFMPMVLIHC